MPIYVDQTERAIFLHGPPQRIISLVPSQTELLADLALSDEVVGITKFCVHPQKWFREKTRIGGTKQLNLDLIRQLQPDLIIANQEENEKEQVLALAKDFPVWVSRVDNLKHAYEMMDAIGEMVNRQKQAELLIQSIKENFLQLRHPAAAIDCCYLIWQNPWMTIGCDTFIHHIMDIAGLKNIFADKERYPTISLAEIKERQPSVIILSSEPFPFGPKHIEALQKDFPDALCLLADGEMFSWYGSRLQYTPAYLQTIIDKLENKLRR